MSLQEMKKISDELGKDILDGFDNFFVQGSLSKDKSGNLYFVGKNEQLHLFAIKVVNDVCNTLTLSELRELKETEIVTMFSYKNKLIFTTADDVELNMFKDFLTKYKDILLSGLELNTVIVNTNLDTLFECNLILAEEIEVTLGYTLKIFNGANGTVTITPSHNIGNKRRFCKWFINKNNVSLKVGKSSSCE